MKVKCSQCDNYNPELNSCSRLEKEVGDLEKELGTNLLSFVLEDDSCSTEDGAVPISDEEFNRKWLWHLGGHKNHKYLVYLRYGSVRYSTLLGCFDTKKLAIEFATGAILSFSNYTLDRDDVRNNFYETYRNHNTYHEVTGFDDASNLGRAKAIGIKEIPYYEGVEDVAN